MARARVNTTKIQGWGADLDPKNRPGVPKEKAPSQGTGAHWKEPVRQFAKVKIHKSTEHKELTPVFGTSCPPRGFSGKLRDIAYQYSEGRMAHWLTLLLADRVDVVESFFSDLIRGNPARPFQEMGLKAEWTRGGLRSRRGRDRADVNRWRNELLFVTGIGALFLIRNSLSRRQTSLSKVRAIKKVA